MEILFLSVIGTVVTMFGLWIVSRDTAPNTDQDDSQSHLA